MKKTVKFSWQKSEHRGYVWLPLWFYGRGVFSSEFPPPPTLNPIQMIKYREKLMTFCLQNWSGRTH